MFFLAIGLMAIGYFGHMYISAITNRKEPLITWVKGLPFLVFTLMCAFASNAEINNILEDAKYATDRFVNLPWANLLHKIYMILFSL